MCMKSKISMDSESCMINLMNTIYQSNSVQRSHRNDTIHASQLTCSPLHFVSECELSVVFACADLIFLPNYMRVFICDHIFI